MGPLSFLEGVSFLVSRGVFAALVAVSAALIWLAIVPSRALRSVSQRLDEHVESRDPIQELELQQPFVKRAVLPIIRRVLGWLGRRMPGATIDNIHRQLVRAGRPWGLTALDFLGLGWLLPVMLGGGYFFLASSRTTFLIGLRNAILIGAVGFLLPHMWLRSRVRRRQRAVDRALPDALDMLSIGVEAGLAFESALLRVSEQWDNALSEEFLRTVREMRLGMARDQALRNMVDRTGVDSLGNFVAVLVQSTQLGVSIADVLHAQAAQMRLKRRQRAEEEARQAGIKMLFPLVFLIFPSMFVVLLGPALPELLGFLANLTGGAAPLR